VKRSAPVVKGSAPEVKDPSPGQKIRVRDQKIQAGAKPLPLFAGEGVISGIFFGCQFGRGRRGELACSAKLT
jgi:hypothetical protein